MSLKLSKKSIPAAFSICTILIIIGALFHGYQAMQRTDLTVAHQSRSTDQKSTRLIKQCREETKGFALNANSVGADHGNIRHISLENPFLEATAPSNECEK